GTQLPIKIFAGAKKKNKSNGNDCKPQQQAAIPPHVLQHVLVTGRSHDEASQTETRQPLPQSSLTLANRLQLSRVYLALEVVRRRGGRLSCVQEVSRQKDQGSEANSIGGVAVDLGLVSREIWDPTRVLEVLGVPKQHHAFDLVLHGRRQLADSVGHDCRSLAVFF
ncbi:hypothetical protein PgNI_11231, partial [Pyricularia grisea]|uniref:Uncharacterized protein n=1 Tax=Pyricularia grisea TaxID=148305 RepID=A0A6P8AQ37_PYRGI